jgi:cytochrome c551/c552
VLFAALLVPAGFAGWAVGHYTSLGKSASTVVHTVTIGTATSTQATTTSTSTSTSSVGGNAAAGKAVFAANGCGSCHTFKPANATGAVGPDLDSAPAADAKADNNMNLAAFINESIVKPDAYIAKGYSKGIMPATFGSSLSKTQLNDLVAFILSGTAKS